ncbi:MAG: TetR/AcrR family transcriptional regulator, partial [Ketobacteraceae bacterium]|nr:TetR/AcrR family transcriptional regulator [Ketobacteraceae bacterium]
MAQFGKHIGKTGKPARTQKQRRETTSAAVLQSAIKLFGRQGYQNTSLEDIAADCGTTIRPIYHYYKNKKSLFLAVAEALESHLLEVLEALENQHADPLPVSAYWQAFTE